MTDTQIIFQPAYPFALDAVTGLKLVEQDTAADVEGTALAVLRTPLGHHDSVSDLGLPEVTGAVASDQDLEQLAVDVTTHYDARAGTIARATQIGMLRQVLVVTAGG